ncbi:homoserine O-succinyltransferase [Hyaloraphidium curvatum]|nr:homoserine O-succinyltransferase [Hyaloraphidium curvatum]
MPIKVPDDLPAARVLEQEGVVVMGERHAVRQDIRPMRIAILNLMPLKAPTETQLARVLGAGPLQVEVTLVATGSYVPRNTPPEHMAAFYKPWAQVRHMRFDGLIVTGAPVEHMRFEEVQYWPELADIMDWARTSVFRTLFICWGAQAGLYHHFGIPKHPLPAKAFGVFSHRVLDPADPLLRGFDDEVPVPVSRHTEVRREDLDRVPRLRVLFESEQTGVGAVVDAVTKDVYVFNHLEYDWNTLGDEYRRDADQGKDIALPANYYPGDDPKRTPPNRWRSHGFLFFGNWLNEVYQGTPFDLADLPKVKAAEAAALANGNGHAAGENGGIHQ